MVHAYLYECNPAEEDWKSQRLHLGCQSEQVIQNTYKVTSTRFGATAPQHVYMKKHFKSRNPVYNIQGQNK